MEPLDLALIGAGAGLVGALIGALARVYRVDGPLTAWAPVDLLVGAA